MLSREASDLLHREHSMHSPNPTPAVNTPTMTTTAAVLPCAAAAMADQVVADAAPAVPAAAGMCEMSTTPLTKSRSTLSSTSLAVAARTAESATTTITMTAQSQPSVVPCTHNTTNNGSGGQGAKVHVVALHLSDGTVVHGTPYRNAVCGHHIMLAVEHGIWKATLAVRERCFYEAIARCTSASDTAWLTMGSGAKEEEDWAHAYIHAAQLLLPFLPRYVGTRRVVAMQLPDRHTRSLSPHTLALLAAEGAPLVTTPAEPSLNKDITENDKAAQQWPCEVVQRVIGQFNAGLQAVQHGSPALREDMEGNASDEARAEERNDNDAVKEEEACALAGSPLARLVHCATAPVPAATQSIEMIAMEDVCYGFVHPCVLDIKMGSRQYGLHPSPAKKRSKKEKALRTTSAKYGIRLAGFKRWDSMRGRYVARSKKELYGLSIDGVREAVRHFFTIDTTAAMGNENNRVAEGGEEEMSFLQEVNTSEDVTRELQDKVIGLLRELRSVFAVQSVFRFFTSSLLCVYDTADPVRTCRIAMIDFAYVYDRVELRCAGDADGAMERDEGYLFALDQLLSLFQDETAVGADGGSSSNE